MKRSKRLAILLVWVVAFGVVGLVWLRDPSMTKYAFHFIGTRAPGPQVGRLLLRAVISVTRGEQQRDAFSKLVVFTGADSSFSYEQIAKTGQSYLRWVAERDPAKLESAATLAVIGCNQRDAWDEMANLIELFQREYPQLVRSDRLNSLLLRSYWGRNDNVGLIDAFQQRFVASQTPPASRLTYVVLGAYRAAGRETEFWQLARREANLHPDTSLGRAFRLVLLTRPDCPEMKRIGARSAIPFSWFDELGKWVVGLRTVPADVPLVNEQRNPPDSFNPSEIEFPLAFVAPQTGAISLVLDASGEPVRGSAAWIDSKSGELFFLWCSNEPGYWAYDLKTKRIRPLTLEEALGRMPSHQDRPAGEPGHLQLR